MSVAHLQDQTLNQAHLPLAQPHRARSLLNEGAWIPRLWKNLTVTCQHYTYALGAIGGMIMQPSISFSPTLSVKKWRSYACASILLCSKLWRGFSTYNIRANVVLDRVAFKERHQSPAETFGDFYIGLRRLAESVDLCGTCLDSRLATRIIVGVCDSETKKKLLALSPFPSAQETVNLCRSEESAWTNEKALSSSSGVSSVHNKQNGKPFTSE